MEHRSMLSEFCAKLSVRPDSYSADVALYCGTTYQTIRFQSVLRPGPLSCHHGLVCKMKECMSDIRTFLWGSGHDGDSAGKPSLADVLRPSPK